MIGLFGNKKYVIRDNVLMQVENEDILDDEAYMHVVSADIIPHTRPSRDFSFYFYIKNGDECILKYKT